MKCLNPFAFMLDRKDNRFCDIDTVPVYVNGDYATYRLSGNHYVTCKGNIVVHETTGIPKRMVDSLAEGNEPKDYSKFRYRRIVNEVIPYALEAAKKIGFEIKLKAISGR